MNDTELQNQVTTEEAPAKKKCCGKLKNFFTKEAQEGQRVLNWKFWLVLVLLVLTLWFIL